VSAAAYAAHVGLPCVVIVTGTVPDQTRRALLAFGARVIGARESLGRWELMKTMAPEGWYPLTNYSLPAVGSNPWGVEGYKTAAFELAAQADPIDAILVPTARGDLLWGLHAGYAMLEKAGLLHSRRPRLIAVEPFPRLSRVLAGEASSQDSFVGTTRQISTGGSTVTDQAVRALRATDGMAVPVSDEQAERAQHTLAGAGIYLELCAAACHAAAETLAAEGWLAAGARVVMIGTSSGFRDPHVPLPALEYLA
jgi:threonine synthase